VTYLVRIKGSAARELKRIDRPVRVRIVEAIDRLAEHPFKGTALKGELKGLRRIRVGEHRIVYEIQDQALVVLVVRVGHRRDVYR
jgi:mRNA interferase RelE/StbE